MIESTKKYGGSFYEDYVCVIGVPGSVSNG